jgi:hypothetical protein
MQETDYGLGLRCGLLPVVGEVVNCLVAPKFAFNSASLQASFVAHTYFVLPGKVVAQACQVKGVQDIVRTLQAKMLLVYSQPFEVHRKFRYQRIFYIQDITFIM